MKNIKLLTYLLLLFSGILFSSCLKDQEDLFPESASTRITNYTNKARKTLMSAENGWIFEVYPGQDQAHGGIVYTVKFDSLTCTVKSQLANDNSVEETSHYKMTMESGSAVIFDSYNSLIHRLSEGTSEAYQALGGDVEFVIDSIGEDMIKVHGARSLNNCFLRRLTKTPTEYLNGVTNIMDNFVYADYYGTVNDKTAHAAINLNNNQITITPDTADTSAEPFSVAYVLTDKGIRLYEPIKINGVTVSEFDFDTEAGTLSANNIVLKGELPKGYRKFEFFEGSYTLAYYNSARTCNVTLSPDKENNCYYMKGIFDNSEISVRLDYNKGKGTLFLNSQKIGIENSNQVWLCAWSLGGGGTLTWDPNAGVQLVWNGNENNPTFTFKDNQMSDNNIDSFIIWTITSTGNSAGIYSGQNYQIAGGVRLAYLTSMTKR